MELDTTQIAFGDKRLNLYEPTANRLGKDIYIYIYTILITGEQTQFFLNGRHIKKGQSVLKNE